MTMGAATDPIRPVSSLLSGRSAKSRLCELELYKAAVGDLTQSAKSCRSKRRRITLPPLVIESIGALLSGVYE